MQIKLIFFFLLHRFSAFMFDLVIISFSVSFLLTIVINTLGIKIEPIEVIYALAQSNTSFKNLLYLLVIALYHFIFLVFKRSTFGMWLAGIQYASRKTFKPKGKATVDGDELIDEDEDENLNSGIEIKPPSAIKKLARHLVSVSTYLILQMVNIALMGAFTIFAAFQDKRIPYHEDFTGVHVIQFRQLTKLERSEQS